MDTPIRVLHVVSSMNLGGIQSLLMNLYRHIDREKVQFDFVVHVPNRCVFTPEIELLGGKIYNAPKFNGKNFNQYVAFWEEFFSSHREYRIVHGHIRTTAAIYLGVANKYKLITIAHSHSTYIEPGVTGIIKRIMEFPLRYIPNYYYACSKEAAICLFGKKKAKKAIILKNAIDVTRFKFNDQIRNQFRTEYSIGSDAIVAGTVGRVVEAKNPSFIVKLIQACSKIDRNFIFVWVGEGDQLEKTIKAVEQNGNQSNVRFLGGLAKPEMALNAMDCFILPSIDEGFGISAIEAQANGLPVLLSDTVPKSAIVLSTTKSLPLNYELNKWAQQILKMCNSERVKDISSVILSGYDIQQVSNSLQNKYLELVLGEQCNDN